MAVDVVALKAEVETLLTDAEDVLGVLADVDSFPGLDKLKPFVEEAQTVLTDVQKFLDEA